MDFEEVLNMIARKAGATINPEFSCRIEALHNSDFGTIMCIQDASKIASLSFNSGWEITVVRGQGDVATPMQKLYINGVLTMDGIHRNSVEEVRGMVYRGLIRRLRTAYTGQRGV